MKEKGWEDYVDFPIAEWKDATINLPKEKSRIIKNRFFTVLGSTWESSKITKEGLSLWKYDVKPYKLIFKFSKFHCVIIMIQVFIKKKKSTSRYFKNSGNVRGKIIKQIILPRSSFQKGRKKIKI